MSKTHAKTVFAYIHEKKQNRLFEKNALLPPPPTPANSNFVCGSGVFEVQTPKKTWHPLPWRDLVVVVVLVLVAAVVIIVIIFM